MKEFPGGSAAARSEQAPSRPRPSLVARRLIFGPRSLLCCFGLNDERIEVLKVLLELGAEPLVFGLHCDQLLLLLLLRERAARGKQREREGQHKETSSPRRKCRPDVCRACSVDRQLALFLWTVHLTTWEVCALCGADLSFC